MNKLTRIAVICFYLSATFAPVVSFAQAQPPQSLETTEAEIDFAQKLASEDEATRAQDIELLKEVSKAAGTGELEAAKEFGNRMGVAIGVGIIVFGGGMGIAIIGGCAVTALARQPELAGKIQTAMIISASLIEGVTLLALIICILCLFV